jgi:hypothetical protein
MKYEIKMVFDSKSKVLPEVVTSAKVMSLVVNKLSPDITKGNLLVISEETESEFNLSDLTIECTKAVTQATASNISQKELDDLRSTNKALEKSLKAAEVKLAKINELSKVAINETNN